MLPYAHVEPAVPRGETYGCIDAVVTSEAAYCGNSPAVFTLFSFLHYVPQAIKLAEGKMYLPVEKVPA